MTSPRLALLAALVLLAASCSPGETLASRDDDSAPRYRLVAYVHGGAPDALARIGADKLTHINYAFANVTPEGRVVLERPAEDAARLAALVGLRERNPRLQILLSVGGWSWSDHFSDAALTAASRQQFAQSAVALVRAHHLDGLDLDWEYPGQPGEGNVYRPEDATTFTLLLDAVRNALDAAAEEEGRADRPYLLTIAAAAGERYLDHTEMAEAQRPLDFVNLMTYDFSGPWSERTGHHTNLSPTPGAPSVRDAVDRIVAAGVPAEKIVVGAAFYGYRWEGVEPAANGLGQTYTGDVSAVGFGELADRVIGRDGFVRHWDDAAEAPFLWNPETRTFISYEDEESIRRKAEYVRERGLGGLMYWQHLHDPGERLLGAAAGILR